MRPPCALVFGGSGAVGGAVVRGLAAAGISTVFTYWRNEERAAALARELGQRALRVDLSVPRSVRATVEGVCAEEGAPDLFVHCAAVGRSAPIAEVDEAEWQAAQAINCQSAYIACQVLAPKWAERGGGNVVLVGALDRTQSVALPVHFAATQGMLTAMTMALAKELGRSGVLVNLVALGLLDAGIGEEIRPALRADYRMFSALRRPGTPDEAARAILWLALENTYMTGKVVSVNGGL